MDSETFKIWFYDKFDSNIDKIVFKKVVKLKNYTIIGILITEYGVWFVDDSKYALDGINKLFWSNKHLINSFDNDDIVLIIEELGKINNE